MQTTPSVEPRVRKRRPGITHPKRKSSNARKRGPKQRAFLRAFAKVGRLDLAASKAGVHVVTHHRWMERDSFYAERFHQVKQSIQLKPPTTLVPRTRKPKPLRNPMGTGSVRQRKDGWEIAWREPGKDGRRHTVREKLPNVSEEEAWRRVIEKVRSGNPQMGPLQYGPEIPIEALAKSLANGTPATRQNRHTVKLAGRSKRPNGTGSLYRLPKSYLLMWYDIDGVLRKENLGDIPLEQAEAIREQRTASVLLRKREAKALALQILKGQPIAEKAKPVAEKLPKKIGRPRSLTDDQRRQDQEAAVTLKPRDWCAVRDQIEVRLTSKVEKYGSWVAAYDSSDPEIRQYLMVKKSQQAGPRKSAVA